MPQPIEPLSLIYLPISPMILALSTPFVFPKLAFVVSLRCYFAPSKLVIVFPNTLKPIIFTSVNAFIIFHPIFDTPKIYFLAILYNELKIRLINQLI